MSESGDSNASGYVDTPTIQEFDYDPSADAAALRKAMKGFGTDEAGLINVLARRTESQRMEIKKQYKCSFGKDLIKDIKSETGGKFEEVLVGLLTPRIDYLAKALHNAISGIGTKDSVLVDIICTSENEDLEQIKIAYKNLYNADLEEDVSGDTSGHFRRILVSLLNGSRSEDDNVDEDAVDADAHALFNAGEGQWGTDESTFNVILATRGILHLREVFAKFHAISGKTIKESVKKEYSGDIEDAMVAIVACVHSPAMYFAKRLEKAMGGMGTDDETLIFIIVSRCDVDLESIKGAYQFKYLKALTDRVKSECSGDYRKALLTLLGDN